MNTLTYDSGPHSPEPWQPEPPDGYCLIIQDSSGKPILGAENTGGNYHTRNALAQGNLIRAMECVNACKGMADPALSISRLTRSVRMLLDMIRPQAEAALASGNVAEEEKEHLRGQLEYFETALNTP